MAAPEPVFRFRHPVEMRFRDLDPMGHVHHSLALVYFEEARASYWRDIAGRSAPDVDYVMGEVTVRYLARIHYPQALEVRVRVSRLGGKSWDMEYQLRSAAGELVATGHSVQVMYDYEAGASIPIPPELAQRIARYEGHSAAAGADD